MLRRHRKFWLASLAVLVIAALAWWSARKPSAVDPAAQAAAVPVSVVKATRQNVPIYLTGLGKVQALNSVTLRSQVDGRIEAMDLREGQDVRAGDLLIQIDARPYQAALEQAQGKQAQDEAQLRNADKTLERDQSLLAKGMVDQQTFDGQKAQSEQLVALVKTDAAAVADARINLDYTRILSPLDGRVGLRMLDPGNIVRASDGTSLAVVNQIRPIAVLFTLPDRDLGRLGPEMRARGVRTVVQAMERGTGRVIAVGELAAVDNQIDAASGTIRLKAVFPNNDLALWPGEFVDARLDLATERSALVVPSVAIQQGPNGTYVFVAAPGNVAELRPVRVAVDLPDLSIIASGLAEGDQVITDGQYLLRAKTRLQIVPPQK